MMNTLPTDALRPGMVLAEAVYLSRAHSLPYLREGTVLSTHSIAALKTMGVAQVRVQSAESPRPPAARPAEPETPPPAPTVAPVLRGEALDNLKNLFSLAVLGEDSGLSAPQLVRQLDSVVDRLVDSVGKDPAALVNIEGLRSYDEYTYHHSLSVAVLSIAIGQALGLPPEELRRLGKCAMMHDIGKTSVPIEIINKPSRLSDGEFEIIKGHPTAGFSTLYRRHIGDEHILQGVLFHHEKIDGTGYPRRLKGEQIPIWSRIITVADVYDALTSHRAYREPMQPAAAVEYVMGGADTAFDYDVVSAFLKRMELYPVGSRLLLSGGQEAVVLGNENPLRPVVRLPATGEVVDLASDLSALSLTVEKLLPGAATA